VEHRRKVEHNLRTYETLKNELERGHRKAA
jgi:hypothetical protein